MDRAPVDRRLALMIIAWLAHILLAWSALSAAQPDKSELESPQWLTGEPLENKLSSATSVTFTGVPLREELTKFSRHEGIGLFIDRRVDPQTQISFNEANLTFEQVLWKLAEHHSLGICQLGEIYYIGPQDVAKTLPLLWFEMKAETTKLRRRSKVKWDSRRPVQWPLLNEPAVTLAALAKDHQFAVLAPTKLIPQVQNRWSQVDGEPAIPHDVWPEILLPDLPVDEQLALLVVGFGLWFQRGNDGTEVQLIDFPSKQRGQLAWNGPPEVRKGLTKLKQQFPDVQFSMKGKTLVANGTAGDLVAATRWLVSQRTARQGAVQMYSLKTNATRQQILAAVCQRLNGTLEFAPELARTMDERVELSVDKVALDELVRQTLDGTNLKFRWQSKTLIVER